MCVSLVAEPERESGTLLSPQFTMMEEMVPSGSVAEKATVTIFPFWAGFGETLEIVTTGGLSFIVSSVVPEPGPALFVAVTVIVKFSTLKLPVDA